jgi:hypothetical protein
MSTSFSCIPETTGHQRAGRCDHGICGLGTAGTWLETAQMRLEKCGAEPEVE